MDNSAKAIKNEISYDLTFIGAGLSCTYTLMHLIRLLEQEAPLIKIKLLVIEKKQ